MRSIALVLTALGVSGISAPLAAQEIQLASNAYVERVDSARTQVVLEPVRTVSRGDRLIYVVEFRNAGTRPVRDFAVTNPLPPTVRFDASRAGDELVSVDGGRSWGRLADLSVREPDGTRRAANAADVTHLRWRISQPLSGGERQRRTFRAIVR